MQTDKGHTFLFSIKNLINSICLNEQFAIDFVEVLISKKILGEN